MLLLVLLVSPVPAAAADVVRFAPLPLEDPKIIYEQFRGLADYLARATDTTLRWVAHDDYADILTGFRDGALDLAYLGPLPYVVLERIDPSAEPLGCFRDADGAADYTCSLVVFGGGIRPADIRGMHIGLTQPYSTCGYLAVSEMLHAAGRSLERDGNHFDYAGSHSEAALGVVRGRYDVAGVKTAIAHRYAHLNLERIAESRPYPGFTLVANTATLPPEVLARLRQAVLALDRERNPRVPGITAGWGAQIRHGTVPPERCDYSGIAATLERLPWPIPGAEPLQ
jgi:phosphonate transport system substrate-binding protein